MRTLSASYIQQKDSLENKPILLFIITGGLLGTSILRRAKYPKNVVFDGYTYYATDIEYEGTSENSAAEIDTATLRITSLDSSFMQYLQTFRGLAGCKVIIRQVFEDTLDDNTAFTDDILYIQYALVGEVAAEWQLTTKLNLLGIRLPRRTFNRLTCQSKFKCTTPGVCNYTGVSTLCGHDYSSCNTLGNLINFGAFPGTGAALWRVPI